jgi:hypothetical protein
LHLFQGCKFLRKVVIPLVDIPASLFEHCTTIECVVFPAAVAAIGSFAFSDCSALRSIDLSRLSADAEIGVGAFEGCGLVEVALPAELRRIDGFAFKNCTSLMAVRLPQKLRSLGHRVFKGCTSLRALALGDVGEHDGDPALLLGGAKLERLELIVCDFESLARWSIAEWLADGAAVLSVQFAGRRLGRVLITAPES